MYLWMLCSAVAWMNLLNLSAPIKEELLGPMGSCNTHSSCVSSKPGWQEKLISFQRAQIALFSHHATFLGQILTKRQTFPKSAPQKSSLKRQHLLRYRYWYRCQPEDLDLAFGQATSRSQ